MVDYQGGETYDHRLNYKHFLAEPKHVWREYVSYSKDYNGFPDLIPNKLFQPDVNSGAPDHEWKLRRARSGLLAKWYFFSSTVAGTT